MTQVDEDLDGPGQELEVAPDETVMVGPAPAQRKTIYADVTYVEHERRPIIPAALRDPQGRKALVKHVGGRYAHKSAYHASRVAIGLYPALVTGYAVRGAYRIGHGFTGWAFDREYSPARAEAIRTLNLVEARAQYRQRKDRVKWRAGVFWTVLGVGLAGGITAYTLLSLPQLVALAVAVFIALAYNGRPMDRPAFKPAVIKPHYMRLTSDMVEFSLTKSGLAKVDKEGRTELKWVEPPQRDGAGYLAVIDLPPGATFEQAMALRASIASGLHVATARLWLEADRMSERRLRLWVADQAMADVDMPVWPLLKAGRVDVFRVFPFGLNARGRIAAMCLMYSNLLVGAIPGQGKSFAARLATLACALDPTCELHIFDLKGGADWLCFDPVAHVIGIGDQPDDIEYLITDLRNVRAEMQRRYALLQQMARAKDPRAPEGKTTRQLANDAAMRMHPLVVAIDEVQVLFGKSCEYKDEAEELLTDIVKRGRAVGVIAIVATQKPDKDSLPTGIRDNVGTRFGMRVLTQQASDMILGGGMSAAGYRCHAFTRADLGVGYLVGASSDADAEVVKTYYADQRMAEQVINRARAYRDDAGTLSGHAVGVTLSRRSALLDDVLEVMVGDRQHCGPLATAMGEAFPQQYAGWDAARLAGALRGQGVANVKQMKINRVGGVVGVDRRDVAAARQRQES